jgi:hypothetical protein
MNMAAGAPQEPALVSKPEAAELRARLVGT